MASNKPRVAYDIPSADPTTSLHWEQLTHKSDDQMLDNLEALKSAFQEDIAREDATVLALWSCVAGYCESLATHKDRNRRFNIFPVPVDALRRMVNEEFVPLLQQCDLKPGTTLHRDAVKKVSNVVWDRAQTKGSARDELHANSLYVCLRGTIDKRSLDCFGAATVAIAGLTILCFNSFLTLSEDHAYESHLVEGGNTNSVYATCEMAIPGNTKQSKEKRGREIAETFRKENVSLTPETSWLYMRKHPVVCRSAQMAIAAAAGNINCTIENMKDQTLVSGQLYEVKREILWILHDAGHLSEFPFGLIELGDCEEHCSSKRGLAWTHVAELGGDILTNEKLFHDAITVSRTKYCDAQTYPYFYAGHYHKDAGLEGQDQEYRLVEALRLYSEASRVASQYTYDSKDSLQLMKHMTAVASVIMSDILMQCNSSTKELRMWFNRDNAVAASTWLVGFFDSLLLWEERGGSQFVEILSPDHKHGLKMFQLFPIDIRCDMMAHIFSDEETNLSTAITDAKLLYFRGPRSKRLTTDGLLVKALGKPKVSIRDMELAVVGTNTGRRAKRTRKES